MDMCGCSGGKNVLDVHLSSVSEKLAIECFVDVPSIVQQQLMLHCGLGNSTSGRVSGVEHIRPG